MLEAKKRLLISRSLLMFRISFCPRENLGKAFSRKSLFPSFSFFVFFIIFKWLKLRDWVFINMRPESFCATHTLHTLRGVWDCSRQHVTSERSLIVDTEGTEGTWWGQPPACPHRFIQRLYRQRLFFKSSHLSLNRFCSIRLLCGLSCTHKTRLALSF